MGRSSDGNNRTAVAFVSPVFVCILLSCSLGSLLVEPCEKSVIFPRPFPVCFFQYLGNCNHQHFRKVGLFGNDFGNRLKKLLVMLAVNILMDSKTGWFLIFIVLFSIPNIFCIC